MKAKCADCGDGRALLRCSDSLLNGCSNYYCLVCWPAHSTEHDWEWNGLTDIEQQAIIERYEN